MFNTLSKSKLMRNIKKQILFFIFFAITLFQSKAAEQFISFTPNSNSYLLTSQSEELNILFDSSDDEGILIALQSLQQDFFKVVGHTPVIAAKPQRNIRVIIGSVNKSIYIQELIKQRKIDRSELEGKNEKYIITTIESFLGSGQEVLVIAGSDRRGTIYGIYELANQIGVSPWYYWADAPVKKQSAIYVKRGLYTDGEPAVKYRGIFLNDEAPALTGWATKTFGGFNHKFYEKVFELILRLKGNFLWPAMWGSAFYDDDPMNGALANKMGVVMGTSHHEPMAMAQSDWHRYVRRNDLPNIWDYAKNEKVLQKSWQYGLERAKDWEKVITIGMRGDGDEAMSEDTNISLLEKVVRDQRKIIEKVTGQKAEKTPQVWALYKEVQDYYDNGMRVPDDVTLLLCDDNWGNLRALPDINSKPRKGGYGMYYHFDYVGAPRNSKWINISPISRVWEQMNLAYRHGVKELWIVNVGDLKPMEYPIQFFLDMAWNPDRFNESNLVKHTEEFCARQFGESYAKEAARLINTYSKYNRRVTPELLTSKTYNLHSYNEFETVKNDYNALLLDAFKLSYLIPSDAKDAYDQLVLFPIQAMANLYEMYYAVAKNAELAEQKNSNANFWADRVKDLFVRDSLLTVHYHTEITGGKWDHIMSQTHIGYNSWQEPRVNVMPKVKYVYEQDKNHSRPVFIEKDGYLSIEAPNYTRKNEGNASWIIIPDMGRTLGAVTTTPVTLDPDINTYLDYDVEFTSVGEAKIELYLSPTLNYNGNKGLSYAISLDGENEKQVNFNGHYRGELGKWQAEGIIKSTTTHFIKEPGKYTLRFRALNPGIVLQKILIDMGGLKPSYLGAPETQK